MDKLNVYVLLVNNKVVYFLSLELDKKIDWCKIGVIYSELFDTKVNSIQFVGVEKCVNVRTHIINRALSGVSEHWMSKNRFVVSKF